MEHKNAVKDADIDMERVGKEAHVYGVSLEDNWDYRKQLKFNILAKRNIRIVELSRYSEVQTAY